MTSPLINARAVAAHFGVTPATINNWARKDEIPSLQNAAGNRRFFDLDDVKKARAKSDDPFAQTPASRRARRVR
jgi:predicted site-specific integrase-resolvase